MMPFASVGDVTTAVVISIGFIAQLIILIWTKVDAAKALRKIEEQTKQIEVIHKATNSMKDELVEEVRAASKAIGIKEEREREGK